MVRHSNTRQAKTVHIARADPGGMAEYALAAKPLPHIIPSYQADQLSLHHAHLQANSPNAVSYGGCADDFYVSLAHPPAIYDAQEFNADGVPTGNPNRVHEVAMHHAYQVNVDGAYQDTLINAFEVNVNGVQSIGAQYAGEHTEERLNAWSHQLRAEDQFLGQTFYCK